MSRSLSFDTQKTKIFSKIRSGDAEWILSTSAEFIAAALHSCISPSLGLKAMQVRLIYLVSEGSIRNFR